MTVESREVSAAEYDNQQQPATLWGDASATADEHVPSDHAGAPARPHDEAAAQAEAAGNAAAEHLSPAFPDRAAWGTASKLRAWQVEALTKYFETEPRDFLAAATPGAGKTTFALRLATELLARGTVDRIVVVAPTEHLKRQWADSADRVGIRIDPMFKNGDGMFGRHYQGVAITYAQVDMNPETGEVAMYLATDVEEVVVEPPPIAGPRAEELALAGHPGARVEERGLSLILKQGVARAVWAIELGGERPALVLVDAVTGELLDARES